jgi:hypothetical protein
MIVVKGLQWQTEPSQQARPSPRYRDSGWFVFLMLLGIRDISTSIFFNCRTFPFG